MAAQDDITNDATLRACSWTPGPRVAITLGIDFFLVILLVRSPPPVFGLLLLHLRRFRLGVGVRRRSLKELLLFYGVRGFLLLAKNAAVSCTLLLRSGLAARFGEVRMC